MGLVTLNGAAVVSLRMTQPRQGRWTADIEADTADDIIGLVELRDTEPGEEIVYHGAVDRGGIIAQSWSGLIVGGTGGLSLAVQAKSYRQIEARDVINELLTDVSESLAPSSAASVLATRLPFWTRMNEQASVALSAVCDAIGATWRVLPSGDVWVGMETWPEAPEPFQVDQDFAMGTVELAPDSISLTPGVTVLGLRVGRVEHCIDEQLRTTFWQES